MNNLPLQPLPWNAMHTEDKRIFVEHAQGAGVFYTVYGAVDSDFGTRWHDQVEGSHGKKEGFESIADVKNWIETDHYPHKMQPYVKPSPTWIDASKRLPKDKEKYLVLTECGKVWTGHYGLVTKNSNEWYLHGYTVKQGWHPYTVTHWMPIPEFSTMQNNKGE